MVTWIWGWILALSFEVTAKWVSALCSPNWLLARQTYLPASWASTRRICIKSPQSWIRPEDSIGIRWPTSQFEILRVSGARNQWGRLSWESGAITINVFKPGERWRRTSLSSASEMSIWTFFCWNNHLGALSQHRGHGPALFWGNTRGYCPMNVNKGNFII